MVCWSAFAEGLVALRILEYLPEDLLAACYESISLIRLFFFAEAEAAAGGIRSSWGKRRRAEEEEGYGCTAAGSKRWAFSTGLASMSISEQVAFLYSKDS